MLLALGQLQLDTAARTAVIGLVESLDPGCIEAVACGADAVWLRCGATIAQVSEAAERGGRPVGLTVDGLVRSAELAAAGAVAVEVRAANVDVAEMVAAPELSFWCTPDVARRALEAGVTPDRLIVEGEAWTGPGVVGRTVGGEGPSAWGAVVRAVHDGVGAVRASDTRAVRRVVTVADRLVAAQAAGGAR
ncbi:hypothetical protein NHL50_17560 [Acidimicrobiia bacterium EGI L10123]|uniref:hypothetical protein n=1 Tax=Salinilacustrithrix flava TaxID=2957203 RepID=UPI003D7C18A0|nr:hypothetical protein [Acidimicrobiia bacterium EGI L10123]